jgi:hypothetical protein
MVVSASFSSARGCAIYYRQSRHVVRDTLIRLFSELRSGGSVPDHSWRGYEETGGVSLSPAFILQPSIASWATFAGRPRDMLAAFAYGPGG